MIKIVCVGSLKEKPLKELQELYLKRIKKYSNIEIIELHDCKIDDEKIALEKEKQQIEKYINKKEYIITLEIEGNQMTSIDFSKKLNEIYLHNSNIIFIIGGSLGLHDDIKEISNYKLSISKMTFPHQLFRIILLEQIYRCYKIMNNERYHK